MQDSLVSPEIVASNINQFNEGGTVIINTKIINRVKIALKLLVFTFLFNKSKFLIPVYSNLKK